MGAEGHATHAPHPGRRMVTNGSGLLGLASEAVHERAGGRRTPSCVLVLQCCRSPTCDVSFAGVRFARRGFT